MIRLILTCKYFFDLSNEKVGSTSRAYLNGKIPHVVNLSFFKDTIDEEYSSVIQASDIISIVNIVHIHTLLKRKYDSYCRLWETTLKLKENAT